MRKTAKLLNKRRKYSEEFRRKIVAEFESGQVSVLQLSKLHSVAFQTIYEWIHRYSEVNAKGTRIVEYKDSSTKKVKDLEAKIKRLEQLIGQQTVELTYLNKLIDLASEDLGIDLKKTIATKSAGTSKSDRK